MKVMPVMVGEACYEGHMQRNWQDVQRYLFWSTLLSGSAGHTYGAAGIWHVGVEGDPGHVAGWFKEQAFDWTTWREGMNYPGSTQLGLGKKLLEQYPWSQFEPHPEWAPGCFAAGIPNGMRVIYLPRRNIYNWSGFTVDGLQPGVPYAAFYFDPATGRRFDQGVVTTASGSWNTPNVPSPQDWVLVMEQIAVAGSPGLLFAEKFSRYSGTQNETQYQSGLKVAYNGNVAGWTPAGNGAMHAVDRANPAGQSNPPDWAVMIWQDNVITSRAFDANAAGHAYRVNFEAGAAVYADASQATQAGDGLLIEVLRGDNSVLARHTQAPGGWAGKMALAAAVFEYNGDGSGNVRLRIGPAKTLTSGRFQGVIDNLIVRDVASKD
jgi:hypothetical protein